MKPVPVLVPFLLLTAAAASADIAPDPEFGQSLAPRETTLVAMTAEEVTITLLAEKAEVRAVFHLSNTGGATKLEVGFPDVFSPSSWSSGKPPEGVSSERLHTFRARVDGEVVAHRHRYLEASESPFERDRPRSDRGHWLDAGWLLWNMAFEASQKRTVEVTYWVPYRPFYRPSLLGDRAFEYILKTGAAWKGPIGKAVISVTFGEGVTRKHLQVKAPEGAEDVEDGIRWVLTDLEPTEDVRIVVRRYVDFEEAARGHTALAQKLQKEGNAHGAVHALASVAKCQEKSRQYEACIATCRKIVAHEKATRAENPEARHRYRVEVRWENPYEPLECRIVRCLVRLERLEDARREAAAAVEALRALLADARAYRYCTTEEIAKRVERYETFAKGGEFED